ncbi:MAG: hypothetical protein JWR85_722 [Marmoricola sp.]|nr:hypothetical protein [Marmoricola sp.]
MIVLLALALVASACTGSGKSEGSSAARPSSSAQVAGLEVSSLAGTPRALADVDGEVWVALADAKTVRRGDDGFTELDGIPFDLVATPHGVWVALVDGPSGALVRIDPHTGEQDLRVSLTGDDTSPESITFDGRLLWVLDARRQRLLSVHPGTGEVGKSIPLDVQPDSVASGRLGVFITGDGQSSLFWLRPLAGHNVIDGVTDLCNGPRGMAVDRTRVWVACTAGDQVVSIDPQTAVAEVSVDLPFPHAIVLTGERVLVVLAKGPTVAVLDRADGTLVRQVALDDQPGPVSSPLDALISRKDLVVAHPGADKIYRIPLAALLSETS